ncbi:hypothetical protein G5I_04291 [Acromyrmex echinatior]|uniref:Uncharacterized protein n=1 Tax=Acromyrmex echinatior TaxID=103372 RepID=F4WF84_ACREC|nr:hypothetical protein G5I_04291 [Acromyrmex echinatior]
MREKEKAKVASGDGGATLRLNFSPYRSRGVSASNIHFHSNIAIAAPREEGTIEVLLEMDFLMKKKTSMFEETWTRPEIESRNSRWAVVIAYVGFVTNAASGRSQDTGSKRDIR